MPPPAFSFLSLSATASATVLATAAHAEIVLRMSRPVPITTEMASAAMWNTFETRLAELPAFDGTHMLTLAMMGGGTIHSADAALASPEDFKNRKIRMGGPIQKQLIEGLEAIPVAGPAPKTSELVDSGVVDASLHPIALLPVFGIDHALTHHTMIEDGFYDAVFFMTLNGKAWDRLSPEDREAIMSVSGETLARQWGRYFDTHNAATIAAMEADPKQDFVTPTPELMSKLKAIRDQMVSDWVADGANFGLPNAQEVVDYYHADYAKRLGAGQ